MMVTAFASIINVAFAIIKPKIADNFKLDDSVCGILHSKGLITDVQMVSEQALSKSLTPTTLLGYSIIVGPLLNVLRRSPLLDGISKFFVGRWMHDADTNNFKFKMIVLQAKWIGLAVSKLNSVFTKYPIIVRIFPITSLVSVVVVNLTVESPHYIIHILIGVYALVFMEACGSHIKIPINHTKLEYYITTVLLITALIVIGIKVDTFLDAFTGAIIIGSMIGSIGFTVGHELGHKNKVNQGISKVIFFFAGYPQFFEVHNRIHHVHIGLEHDSSTAKMDQGLVHYIAGQWNLYVTNSNSLTYLMVIGIGACASVSGVLCLYMITVVCTSWILLEVVNYVQHWGLVRGDKITAHVSWDTDNSFTNAYLYNLGNHGHHHTSGRMWHSDLTMRSDNVTRDGYFTQIFHAIVINLAK
jgi:hypothetical protein